MRIFSSYAQMFTNSTMYEVQINATYSWVNLIENFFTIEMLRAPGLSTGAHETRD